MSKLLKHYKEEVLPVLMKELGLKNRMAVPRLQKVVVNAGIGKLLQNQPKALEAVTESLAKITGQKPVASRAKKAISAFKIREGQIVGTKVTLRGRRMYDFLEKLIGVGLPRTRDFRGISRKGFDGRGNYTLGFREQIVFPEMAQEELSVNFGAEISIATTAESDEAGYLLLKKLGFPFKD